MSRQRDNEIRKAIRETMQNNVMDLVIGEVQPERKNFSLFGDTKHKAGNPVSL